MTWAQRAEYGYLGAVLDPADTDGRKNAFIDTLHKIALRSNLGRRHFSRALDFGCGTGRFLPFLASRASNIVAFDRTPEMLSIAQSSHPTSAECFICSRESVLPFADAVFDLVLSVYVISCTPRDDTEHLTRELMRVCKPGGMVALIEQIDNSRKLSPSTYADMFNRDGAFSVRTAVPIRAGSSPLIQLVQKVSTKLHPLLARLELARMSKKSFTGSAVGYWDYLLIATKVPGSLCL